MTLLDIARAYVAKGLSVIPLVKRDKIPDGSVLPDRSWKVYQERRATDEELVSWFESGERNIGIVTGAISGFVVVDLDGPDGLVESEKLGLSSPLSVVTGRIDGGRHLYFKHPGGVVGNGVKVSPGIDIRADGGYCVAPPSVHSNGRAYQWVKGPGEIPVYPEHPARGSGERGRRIGVSGVATEKGGVAANQKGWIEEALKSLGPGNRDLPITRIVGRLHHDGWMPGDIQALLGENAEVQAHGLGELSRIIRSITAKPRDGELPEDSLSAFMSNEAKVEWIVPGIIARASLGFVAGVQETNKSWLMFDLAIEAARGGLWLGKFPVNKTKTIFIDQERFHAETRRRLRALMDAKAIGAAQLDSQLTVWSGTSIRIDLEQSFNALDRRMEAIRPELIIVDSFATFHTKEDNSRSDMQVVFELVKKLRQKFGCAFIERRRSLAPCSTSSSPPGRRRGMQMALSAGKKPRRK